jgi:hypothetical protein
MVLRLKSSMGGASSLPHFSTGAFLNQHRANGNHSNSNVHLEFDLNGRGNSFAS